MKTQKEGETNHNRQYPICCFINVSSDAYCEVKARVTHSGTHIVILITLNWFYQQMLILVVIANSRSTHAEICHDLTTAKLSQNGMLSKVKSFP